MPMKILQDKPQYNQHEQHKNVNAPLNVSVMLV